jgi:hypothetical protein
MAINHTTMTRRSCLYTSRSPKCEHAAAYVYDAKIFGQRERERKRERERGKKMERETVRERERGERERQEIGRAQEKEYVWGVVTVINAGERERDRKRERKRESARDITRTL